MYQGDDREEGEGSGVTDDGQQKTDDGISELGIRVAGAKSRRGLNGMRDFGYARH